MLSSKHQVVLVMVVISLTIPNSIQDSFNNTKAISRAKKINIFGEAKIDRRDSEVSKEATTTLLKMPKLPRKVVLRKPKVKMTVPRYRRCGKKVATKQKGKMQVPMKRKCGRKGQRYPWFPRTVAENSDKNGEVPKHIISIPMTVMSSGIRTIVRILKQLVTVDRENKQLPGGPRCMQQCLRRGSLHPAQCHQLC